MSRGRQQAEHAARPAKAGLSIMIYQSGSRVMQIADYLEEGVLLPEEVPTRLRQIGRDIMGLSEDIP